MSEQDTLFPLPKRPERAHARRTDPETSHWAAAGVRITQTQERVLLALRIAGPSTDEEIVDYIHKTWPEVKVTEQSVRSRRAELVQKLLVRFSGTYGTTRNGNKSRIWEAVIES